MFAAQGLGPGKKGRAAANQNVCRRLARRMARCLRKPIKTVVAWHVLLNALRVFFLQEPDTPKAPG